MFNNYFFFDRHKFTIEKCSSNTSFTWNSSQRSLGSNVISTSRHNLRCVQGLVPVSWEVNSFIVVLNLMCWTHSWMMAGCLFCHVALPTSRPSSFRPSSLPSHCGLVKYTCKLATAQEKVRDISKKSRGNWKTCWFNTTDLEKFWFRHYDQCLLETTNQIIYQWSYRIFSIKHPPVIISCTLTSWLVKILSIDC